MLARFVLSDVTQSVYTSSMEKWPGRCVWLPGYSRNG